MLQFAGDYESASSSSRKTGTVPQLDLLAVARILHRRWRPIAVTVGLFLVLGVIYLAVAPRKYTADFLILIDPRPSSIMTRDATAPDRVIDPGMIESQVEILGSDSVAHMVVRSLGLAHDRSFMEGGFSPISAILGYFNPPARPTEADLEQDAVDKLTANTKAARVGVTYVIQVSYTGKTPDSTAQIANALANAYTDSQLEARYDATRRATTWLQSRLQTLRGETSAAELAVQKFKADNNIVDTARGLMSDQQLTDANSQLAAARNETNAAKARLDRIQDVFKNNDVVNATVPEALKDEVLNRLRAQYLDLSSRMADLSNRFGPTHGAVINLRNQMTEITKAARDELGRLAESSRSDYAIAQANEKSVKANLDTQIAQADQTSKAQVKLRDLESSAQTFRNLYDNMLQKLQESTQEQTSPDASARVITPAAVPSGPSSPKLILVLGGSIVGGLMVGAMLALVRELLSNAFKTPDDVKSYAGLECLGTLPRVQVSRSAIRALRRTAQNQNVLGSQTPVARQSVLAPFSRFTETIRNVKVSIDIAKPGKGAAITGMVSSVPKEGKTTFSSNLALLTASMGHRTLLIDADMHNPSLTRTLYGDAKLGLPDVLSQRCTADQAIVRDATTGLDFLPTVLKERQANIVNLLTSQAMADLLERARHNYDYVFVDLPPIVPVVDVKAAAHMFDNFVFVLEWGRTSRDVVRDAMITSEQVRQRIIGVVLNKADPLELKRIESYRGPEYGSYYLESTAA